MKRDVVVVNQMTGPSMVQDRLCADVLAWRRAPNGDTRCKQKHGPDKIYRELTNNYKNILGVKDPKTKRRHAAEHEAFNVSSCCHATDSDATKRQCVQKISTILVKRSKAMYQQAFCDAGMRQHSTVMDFTKLRELKNQYGYYGTKFIKRFLQPFGIKGPCEAALRTQLKENSLQYITGSYTKRIKKEPKKLQGPMKFRAEQKAKLTNYVEKIVTWAVVEGFEQALQDVLQCLLELLRWQPGTDACKILIQPLWDKVREQPWSHCCSHLATAAVI
jgi:hypothetical protein